MTAEQAQLRGFGIVDALVLSVAQVVPREQDAEAPVALLSPAIDPGGGDKAIEKIKDAITKTYARKSAEVVRKNHEAVDSALAELHEVHVPANTSSDHGFIPPVPEDAPKFVRTVTASMLKGRGDDLPVSSLPVDGTYPSGTTKFEKRNISEIVAEWDAESCIQCGNCAFVCPHSVLRAKSYPADAIGDAPEGFLSAPLNAAGLPQTRYTLQTGSRRVPVPHTARAACVRHC